MGGEYVVTAKTTDGSNCTRSLTIKIKESKIATITKKDITVKDLTEDKNNTIAIDTTSLGIGDYEFAIDDEIGPYQDEPLFEKVRPGIHTIYVRDKNNFWESHKSMCQSLDIKASLHLTETDTTINGTYLD